MKKKKKKKKRRKRMTKNNLKNKRKCIRVAFEQPPIADTRHVDHGCQKFFL